MKKFTSNKCFNFSKVSTKIERYYLSFILIAAFLIRLIPSRNLAFAGRDAYLHYDIVMRIVEEGFGIISRDPITLMGLESYSYPPLYHIIATILYNIFQSDLVFFLWPPLLGVFTIYVFYHLSQQIFMDKRISLLSTLLFAFAPSFLTRTSVFIPESLGMLLLVSILFLIVKYVKSIPGYENLDTFALKGFWNIFKGDYKYLILAGFLWLLYLLNHRGWIFLGLAVLILIFTLSIPSIRKKPLEASIIITILVLLLYFLDVWSYFARLQIVPVSVLGFPKWVGVFQLIFGIYGAIIFIKSKNPLYKFLALWGVIFLLIGSYSFRFRDPYSAVALSLMGGYVFSKMILPKVNHIFQKYSFNWGNLNINKGVKTFIIFMLVLTPVAQGAFSAYSLVVQPSSQEVETFEWINMNTPTDAIFLTMRDDAYLLIGNTHRRDVLLWKIVYQGFMGDPPTVEEAILTQNDVNTIFGTSQPSESYFLLEKYDISYVYVTRMMYTMTGARYGLLNYLPSSNHFQTAYITGDTAVYEYNADPPLEAPESTLNIPDNEKYSPTIQFIEKFWNGYSYSDAGGNYFRDQIMDLEFGGSFKGDYALNAQIVNLFDYIYDQTNDPEILERSQYLLNWLEYKQMPSGSFPSGTPPGEYTLGTMETIYPLLNLESDQNNNEIIQSGLNFVQSQTSESNINISNRPEDTPGIFEDDFLSLKTNALVSGMNPDNKEKIINDLLLRQRNDGSWSDYSYQNIGILKGLSLYYQSSEDEKVLNAIEKGSAYLKSRQNLRGVFEDDGTPQPYAIHHYADTIYIHSVAGDGDAAQLTLDYLTRQNIKQDINPLKSYLSIYFNLSPIYGEEFALEIANQVI